MTALVAVGLAACAGRDPQPVALVQVQDSTATCLQIRAEVEANNAKVQQLADEKGLKVAQNVGAGLVGIIIWPVWFGMDFKDAAGKDLAALQARQQYLATLATERCTPSAASPPQPAKAAKGRQATRAAPSPLAPASAAMPVVQTPDPQLSESDRTMNSRN